MTSVLNATRDTWKRFRRTGRLLGVDGAALNGFHKHRVITRGGDFVSVSEGHPAIFEDGLHGTSAGSEDNLAALAHPDRGLVGALEAVYRGVRVVVGCDGDVTVTAAGL